MMLRASLFLALSMLCGSAAAATFAVGTGTGCTHATLQAALDAAAGNAAGPHLVKLVQGTRFVPAGSLPVALVVVDPAADVEIAGGYASCTAPTPTSGQRTTLLAPSGSGLLQVVNDNANTRRVVTLRALTLSGARYELGGFFGPGVGGAVGITGKVSLRLAAATEVSNNSANLGGGIALSNVDAASSSDNARLYLEDGSRISGNTANTYSAGISGVSPGKGGGIYAAAGSTVYLWDGEVTGNQANIGGGIAIQGSGSALLMQPLDYLGEQVGVSDNKAVDYVNGVGGDVHGVGGGIHSSFADIDVFGAEAAFSLVMEGNRAYRGGAIYVKGDQTTAGEFTSIRLRNALLESNIADDSGGAMYSLGAVDWVLDSASSVPCSHAVLGSTLCSLVYDNIALNEGLGKLGAAVVFLSSGTSDAHRGIARIRRTAIIGNASQGGSVAVGMGDFDNEFFIERSILAGNASTGALLRSYGPMRCYYCTITGNAVDHLFYFLGDKLYLQGSILWNPGADVRFHIGPTVVTNGCLLAHSATGLPSGTLVSDPKLDADFVPGVPSQALDRCDNAGYAAIADAYNHAEFDIPGIDNQPLLGLNDLGAIEQVDVIFYGGFGYRPTH